MTIKERNDEYLRKLREKDSSENTRIQYRGVVERLAPGWTIPAAGQEDPSRIRVERPIGERTATEVMMNEHSARIIRNSSITDEDLLRAAEMLDREDIPANRFTADLMRNQVILNRHRNAQIDYSSLSPIPTPPLTTEEERQRLSECLARQIDESMMSLLPLTPRPTRRRRRRNHE